MPYRTKGHHLTCKKTKKNCDKHMKCFVSVLKNPASLFYVLSQENNHSDYPSFVLFFFQLYPLKCANPQLAKVKNSWWLAPPFIIICFYFQGQMRRNQSSEYSRTVSVCCCMSVKVEGEGAREGGQLNNFSATFFLAGVVFKAVVS